MFHSINTFLVQLWFCTLPSHVETMFCVGTRGNLLHQLFSVSSQMDRFVIAHRFVVPFPISPCKFPWLVGWHIVSAWKLSAFCCYLQVSYAKRLSFCQLQLRKKEVTCTRCKCRGGCTTSVFMYLLRSHETFNNPNPTNNSCKREPRFWSFMTFLRTC